MIAEAKSLGWLTDLIDTNDVAVVYFTAPAWCVPCRKFAPHFEKASEQAEAVFVKVDVDQAEPDVLEEFAVQSVPTVKLFRNGQYVTDLQARTVVPFVNEIHNA